MIFQINKIKIVAILLIMLHFSCHNHKEGDGHNHGTTELKSETKKEEQHEEAHAQRHAHARAHGFERCQGAAAPGWLLSCQCRRGGHHLAHFLHLGHLVLT